MARSETGLPFHEREHDEGRLGLLRLRIVLLPPQGSTRALTWKNDTLLVAVAFKTTVECP